MRLSIYYVLCALLLTILYVVICHTHNCINYMYVPCFPVLSLYIKKTMIIDVITRNVKLTVYENTVNDYTYL